MEAGGGDVDGNIVVIELSRDELKSLQKFLLPQHLPYGEMALHNAVRRILNEDCALATTDCGGSDCDR